MSRSTIIIALPHFATLSVSGRWLSSSTLTTGQAEEVIRQIKRDGASGQERPQGQWAALESAQTQSHSSQPSKIPQPPTRPPPCRCSPRKSQPPHRLCEPLQTVGLCDSTIPCPARRPGPRTDSWKSLRPPMTPFKASSVWLFDSWLTFAGEWR